MLCFFFLNEASGWLGGEGGGCRSVVGRGLTSAVCLGTTLHTSAVNSHVTLQAAAVGALRVSDGGERNAGYGDGSAAGCSGPVLAHDVSPPKGYGGRQPASQHRLR